MSAVLCTDCGRIVYARDVDDQGYCVFCAPPDRGATADAEPGAAADTSTSPPPLPDDMAEALEQSL